MSQRFYATTPIYYVNDKPHIGHAYTSILADTTRRFRRLFGDQTYFVTGVDEHGQKVQQAAVRRGVEPLAHVNELHRAFKELLPEIGCEPEQFIRTTETRHARVVQRALQQLWDKKLIEAREFEGWYSTSEERFWTEKDLVDGKCPISGNLVIRLKEKNYFFLMSRYQDRLIEAIESGAMRILPASRANEVLGFLREPLLDLCISRPKARLSWGIELPFDTEYVTYVWFDALLNYVTALGGLGAESDNSDELGPDAPPVLDGESTFTSWWPGVTHFLGKDILTTHCVYWPAMLMALELPVPANYVAHGWWMVDSGKMSKTTGNVVSPLSLKDKYGAEVLRYFLMREMAVGQDANFSEEALVGRNNADLANDLGNLVQRTLAMVVRNFDGHVPGASTKLPKGEVLQSAIALGRYLVHGQEADGKAANAPQCSPVRESIEQMRMHVALADVMVLVQRLNQVLAADAPFKVVKTDPAAAAVTIYNVLCGIRIAANLLSPVMPHRCAEILRRIGCPDGPIPLAKLNWEDLPAGAEVVQAEPLFPKHEFVPEGGVEAPKGKKKKKSKTPELADGEVDFPTFLKMDLRVGQVNAVEAVPKSKKLLRLEVDLGELGIRQILAGVKGAIEEDSLLGRRIVVLANLPPRKMMGLMSQGMMLVAEDADGKLSPLGPADDMAPGSKIS